MYVYGSGGCVSVVAATVLLSCVSRICASCVSDSFSLPLSLSVSCVSLCVGDGGCDDSGDNTSTGCICLSLCRPGVCLCTTG